MSCYVKYVRSPHSPPLPTAVTFNTDLSSTWSWARFNFWVSTVHITVQLLITWLSAISHQQHSRLHDSMRRRWSCYVNYPRSLCAMAAQPCRVSPRCRIWCECTLSVAWAMPSAKELHQAVNQLQLVVFCLYCSYFSDILYSSVPGGWWGGRADVYVRRIIF